MARRLAVAFVALLLLTATGWLPVPASAQELDGLPVDAVRVKVSSYVDGDKIKVALDGDRVELNFIGADAPEPKECHAEESNAAIKTLLPKGTVLYLEQDAENTDGKDRLLRHVWAEGKGGEAYLVNAKLIRDGTAGWKAADAEDGNAKYAERYEKAQADAQARGNGLWAECDRLHSKARTKSEQRASAERADARRATEAAVAAVPTEVPYVAPTEVPYVPPADTGTYVGNDGCTYQNVDGVQVSCPVYADTPPAGATAKCNDGAWSFSQNRRGTCSGHGGVAYWL